MEENTFVSIKLDVKGVFKMYILFLTQVKSINNDKLHLATEESLNLS